MHGSSTAIDVDYSDHEFDYDYQILFGGLTNESYSPCSQDSSSSLPSPPSGSVCTETPHEDHKDNSYLLNVLGNVRQLGRQ